MALSILAEDEDSLRRAGVLNDVAILQTSTGAYAAAQALGERMVAIKKRTLGDRHPDVAVSLSNLANVHNYAGTYEKAKLLQEEALSIFEEALGPEHPEVAQHGGPAAARRAARQSRRPGQTADRHRRPAQLPRWPRRAPCLGAGNRGRDAHGLYAIVKIPGQPRKASGRTKAVVQRLRYIEAGHFRMGSQPPEPERFDDEGPQHPVTLSAGFWLADTACTQALWEAVIGNSPSHFNAKNRGGPQHPVEQVSWDDVQGFLRALENRLPGVIASLPSEIAEGE